ARCWAPGRAADVLMSLMRCRPCGLRCETASIAKIAPAATRQFACNRKFSGACSKHVRDATQAATSWNLDASAGLCIQSRHAPLVGAGSGPAAGCARGSSMSAPRAHGAFPRTRMRRNRRWTWSRALTAEHRLAAADLIWPVFVREGKGEREAI